MKPLEMEMSLFLGLVSVAVTSQTPAKWYISKSTEGVSPDCKWIQLEWHFLQTFKNILQKLLALIFIISIVKSYY